jgi:large subunit ribosomal protein L23
VNPKSQKQPSAAKPAAKKRDASSAQGAGTPNVASRKAVLLRPLVTEKSLARAEREHTYTFEVARTANKIQIREAVQHAFKVTVTGVRTQRLDGKARRMGRWVGRTADRKKAIVRVKAGDSIEFV